MMIVPTAFCSKARRARTANEETMCSLLDNTLCASFERRMYILGEKRSCSLMLGLLLATKKCTKKAMPAMQNLMAPLDGFVLGHSLGLAAESPLRELHLQASRRIFRRWCLSIFAYSATCSSTTPSRRSAWSKDALRDQSGEIFSTRAIESAQGALVTSSICHLGIACGMRLVFASLLLQPKPIL